MGVRKKVVLTLVIVAVTQIATRHCMPKALSKSSLKRYLNDVKNNPNSSPFSRELKTSNPTFGKTSQYAKSNQNSLSNKSIFKTYNFPEIEYPHDNSPRNNGQSGMKFNPHYQVNTPQQVTGNLQSSTINNLKKEMKMKRKLLRNIQINNESINSKRDNFSPATIVPTTDSMRLLDSTTFPEVQYPLNAMEMWSPKYWNYSPFSQKEEPSDIFGLETFKPNINNNKKPFKKLTKASAKQFLKSYEQLKEEQKRSSTENSKRSNIGIKGLNFTKTATSEKVSEDFIAAGLNNSSNNKTTLELNRTHKEYTTELPIPYKAIQQDTKNISPKFHLNNNTENEIDLKSNLTAQSKFPQSLKVVRDMEINDITNILVPINNLSTKGAIAHTSDEISTDITGIKELSESNNTQPDYSQNNLQIPSEETTPIGNPLNVKIPLPVESHPFSALLNVPTTHLSKMEQSSNVNSVPGSTSIIIIPVNNGVGQSQFFETTSESPIIVYVPTTQTSGIPTQTHPSIHNISLSVHDFLPNSPHNNIMSNLAPPPNDSLTFVNDLTDITTSGSPLPIYESLPTNSMCNNDNCRSSLGEIRNLFYKSLRDTPSNSNGNEKINDVEHSKEAGNVELKADTLPSSQNFELPSFNLPYNDITMLNENINEMPIIAREINLDQQEADVPLKDLFITTHNVTSENLHNHVTNSELLFQNYSSKKHLPKKISVAMNMTTSNVDISTDNLASLPETPDNKPLPFAKTPLISSFEKPANNSLPNDENSQALLKTVDKTIDTFDESELYNKIPTPLDNPIDRILLLSTDASLKSIPSSHENLLQTTVLDSRPIDNKFSSETQNDFISMDKTIKPTLISDTNTDSPTLNPKDELLVHSESFKNPADNKFVPIDSISNIPVPDDRLHLTDTIIIPSPDISIPNSNLSIDGEPIAVVQVVPDSTPIEFTADDLSVNDLPLPIDEKLSISNPPPVYLPLPIKVVVSETKLTDMDKKNLLQLMKKTSSPIDDANSDILITDIPTTGSLSDITNNDCLELLDKVISESPVSNTSQNNIADTQPKLSHKALSKSLTNDSMISSKDKVRYIPKDTRNETSSSSLPITKALLENVLSDMTEGHSSLPVATKLPVQMPSQSLDKTYYFLKSPHSKDNPTLPLEKTLSDTSFSKNSIDRFSLTEKEDTLPFKHKMVKYEPDLHTNNFKNRDTTGIIPLLTDKMLYISEDMPLEKNKTPLTDTNKQVSLPISEALPEKATSKLDKTLYYTDPPLGKKIHTQAAILEKPTNSFPTPEGNPIAIKSIKTPILMDENAFDTLVYHIEGNDKNPPENSKENNQSSRHERMVSHPNNTNRLPKSRLHSASRLPNTQALLENVLSDLIEGGFRVPGAMVEQDFSQMT